MYNSSRIISRTLMIVIPVLLFASYLYIATAIRPMADDYCIASDGMAYGPLQTVINSYQTWTGRYTAYFIVSAMGVLGHISFAILPMLIIISWLLLLIWIAQQLFTLLNIQRNIWVDFFAASLFLFAALSTMPAIQQSIYWAAGSASYGLPLVVMTGYIGFALFAIRHNQLNSPLAWVIGIVIPLISAGFSETYAMFQIVLLFLAVVASRLFLPEAQRGAAMRFFGVGFIAAIIGFLILAAAPGNSVRRSRFTEEVEATSIIDYLYVVIAPPLFYLLDIRSSAHLFAAFIGTGTLIYFLHPAQLTYSSSHTPALPRLPLWFMVLLQLLILALFIFGADSWLIEALGGLDNIGELIAVFIILLIFWGALAIRRRPINRILVKMEKPERYYLGLLGIGAILLTLIVLPPWGFFTRLYLFINWAIIGVYWFLQVIRVKVDPILPEPWFYVLASGGLAIMLLVAIFTPSVIVTGEIAVARVWSLSSFIRAVVCIFWGGIFGLIFKALNPLEQVQEMKPLRNILLIGGAAALLLPIDLSLQNFNTGQELGVFASAWDERTEVIEQALADGTTEMIFAPLPNEIEDWALLYKMTADPADNTCEAAYFGLESIAISRDEADGDA